MTLHSSNLLFILQICSFTLLTGAFDVEMPPKATAATKKAKRAVVSDSDESSDQASEPECGEQRSFYDILGVEKTANAATIKKAYHKLALLSHPDKNKDDPGATANFQRLQKIYSVLSDERKRKIYDQTGRCEDDVGGFEGMDSQELYDYFRAIYGRVTEEDIDSYKVKYRFCDAEKEDLLEFYSNHGGDLTNILEFIPYSDEEDLERYACWFSLQIQSDSIKCTKKFKPWLKTDVNDEEQQRLWEEGKAKLQKEFKKRKASSGKASRDDSLVAALQSRALQRKQGFEALFAKYGATPEDEPQIDDDEFERIRRNLVKKSGSGKRSGGKATRK